MGTSRKPPAIRTVNLEAGMPLVREALAQLNRELTLARQQRCPFLKFIHGYRSTGAGGDIRLAIQKRLRELREQGAIRFCIFGEDWFGVRRADLVSAEVAAHFEGRLRFRQAQPRDHHCHNLSP